MIARAGARIQGWAMERQLTPEAKFFTPAIEALEVARKFWNSKIQIVKYILFSGEQDIFRGKKEKNTRYTKYKFRWPIISSCIRPCTKGISRGQNIYLQRGGGGSLAKPPAQPCPLELLPRYNVRFIIMFISLHCTIVFCRTYRAFVPLNNII